MAQPSYPPAPEYRWIPPEIVAKMRRTLPRLGVVTMVLGAVLAVAIPIVGYQLPTSYAGSTALTTSLASFAALCTFASGIVVLASRSCVSTGWLKGKSAYNFRVALSGAFAGSLGTLPVFFMLYPVTVLDSGNHPPQPQLHFTVSIVLYMLSPVVSASLTGANFFIAGRLLRPSPALLHRYSRPGPGW